MARSGHNALDPAAPQEAPPPGAPDAAAGPVPAANRPGHHPEHEQDQPDLDELASRLGIEDPEAPPSSARLRTVALVGAGVAVAVGIGVTVAGLLRRRGRSVLDAAGDLAAEVAQRTPLVRSAPRPLTARAGDVVDAVVDRTPLAG